MSQNLHDLCWQLADDLAILMKHSGTLTDLPVELSQAEELLKRARLQLTKTGEQPESRLKQLEDEMRSLGERYAKIEQSLAKINLELAKINLELDNRKEEIDVINDSINPLNKGLESSGLTSMVEEVDLAIARAPMSFEVTDAFAAKDAIRAVASSLRKKGPTWAQESTAEAFADFIEQQAGE